MPSLPIEAVLDDLHRALAARPEAVLQAPTGAGKTTRVPLALLEAEWLDGKKVIVLEPRRLAARAAARRMASMRGERVGDSVGYRVRLDSRVSKSTRVEVVTEGILTRMIQDDPMLSDVGCVIFDEFHERNLQGDLSLALTLEARAALRPELRVLVMSATLDAEPVAALLGDAPMITSEGRSYPVEEHYVERAPEGWIEPHVVQAVRRALAEEEGDLLVFLPGAGEIRRTLTSLRDEDLPPGVRLAPLFGNLSNREQDAAIEPSGEGERKVVLATDIAETSLTIEGVRVVVDAGLQRRPRFDPQSGMTKLETKQVSRASADQRKGRAGRVAPGVCYRLWTPHQQQHLKPHTPPEIANADLAPLALELACWGTDDPNELEWLDAPPEQAYANARRLLLRLGALDGSGNVTSHGREMNALGVHPRLAHMMIRGRELGWAGMAADLAALLSERDILKGNDGPPDSDLRIRLQLLRDERAGRRLETQARGYRIDRHAVRNVTRVADHWRRRLGGRGEGEIEACGLLAAFAYPDRIAQRLGGQEGRFRMRSGRPAAFQYPQLLSTSDYLVAAHLAGHGRERRIALAAPVVEEELREHFGEHLERSERYLWDDGAGRVRPRFQEHIGAVVLKEGPLAEPDPGELAQALIEGIRERGAGVLPWNKKARQLQQRIVFMHRHDESWPNVSDASLINGLEQWLKPYLYGKKTLGELQQLSMTKLLKDLLSWERRNELDELAPTHFRVPSGSHRPIDYSDPEAPVLAVRLQKMFGLTQTPRIAGGRVPLTLHLLSPARRPVQITQDLANFWDSTYFEVKKDMMGRYPKHYWPDDPYTATPTNKVRPD